MIIGHLPIAALPIAAVVFDDGFSVYAGDSDYGGIRKGRRIPAYRDEALELLSRDYLIAIENGELPIDKAIAVAQELMRTNFALYAEQGWPQIYERLLAAKAEQDTPGKLSIW